MISRYKIKAYTVLVRAGKYILEESDRTSDEQILVPDDYKLAVAEYMVQ